MSKKPKTATKTKAPKIYISTLRPGLLVNIKTSIKGNVSYDKGEEKVTVRKGVEISEWETTKFVQDPKEQAEAVEIRSKARNLIVGVCAVSEFGLLCPDNKRDDLNVAFAAARKLCSDFNARAKTTTVKFNALAGHIAADDINAVRAINSEVRDLLAEMKAGIKELDVERVRDAANRVTKLGTMLAPDAQARIAETLTTVRAKATEIKKAGDTAAAVVNVETIKALNSARTAFLDLDGATEVKAAADTTARAVDFEAAPEAPAKAPKGKGREIEIA